MIDYDKKREREKFYFLSSKLNHSSLFFSLIGKCRTIVYVCVRTRNG